MATEFTNRLPLPIPLPNSLTVADAAKWYRASVPLIFSVLDRRESYEEPLSYAWALKSRLRLAAALSLYDQELVNEFFEGFPLAPIESLIHASSSDSEVGSENPTLLSLLTISKEESMAFPGTVGEAIGLELWDGKQHWVMTEDGWAPRPE